VRREPPHTPPNTRIGESPIQPLTPSRARDCSAAHPTPPDLANQKKASGPNSKSPNRKKPVPKNPNATQQAASRHPRQAQTNSKSTHPPTTLYRKLTPLPPSRIPSPTRAHTPKNPPTPLRPPRSRLPPRPPRRAAHCPRRRAAQRHPSGRAVCAAAAHGAKSGRRDGGVGGGGAVVYGAKRGVGAA